MKSVIAAALGECVHVAGIYNFLRLAEQAGWRTVFLGPAVSVKDILEAAVRERADLVGVSYRLTPETGERLLGQFAEEAADLHAAGVRFAFGGTPPVAERARALGFFERVFDGSHSDAEVLDYLRSQPGDPGVRKEYPQDTIGRIHAKRPYPILRHHFGLPTMQATLEGIRQIAEAEVLDVISLGIDQEAQENFFHPERQDPRRTGAGGVPVRSREDYHELYEASRRGNFPLLRTYSGSDDFLLLADLYLSTIHNAWCAIPLFWFNRMDGRGPWDLEGSIREHQKVMAYYGQQHIPVELNEPHHWGMRDAPDVVMVTSAFLSAYNAKVFGVQDYIAQLMFNSPPGLSDAMDLAKMLAIRKLIEPLREDQFRIWYQTRTGLLSYPLEKEAARAHLSASIYLQMALHPEIVHVVSHSEADHAATPDDVMAACRMARRVIDNAVKGQPDMLADLMIQARSEKLVREAGVTLAAIAALSPNRDCDPWANPAILAQAVGLGILDAPQLKNNPYARGDVRTEIRQGMCLAVDSFGNEISEEERIRQVMNRKVGKSE